MLKIIQEALTFDDVLLSPSYSTVLPNKVDVKTKLTAKISLNIPLISSAMDSVTESRLAIAMAQEGGIGILHKNMSIKNQAIEVKKVKKFENGMVIDPVTATAECTIRELLKITSQYHFSGVPVVDGKKLIGIVTGRDIRFAKDLDQPIKNIMTTQDNLVTIKEGSSEEEVQLLLHKHRIEKLLVVNDDFDLVGLITVKDIQKAIDKPNACKDSYGQLMVGAAIGVGDDANKRIDALVAAGVDVIVIDTAHGHSEKVLSKVRRIRELYPNMQIIAGNIATAGAALALAEAGANAVKVGIGPGSICTTRIIAGVGVPQLTAISNVYNALKDTDITVIADGGIRYSGDIVKAIAAGASVVMIGSLFAGTEESPGTVELFQGRSYKSYRGMGSLAAMAKGSSDRYFQADVAEHKLVPEGIEGRVPYKGSITNIIYQLVGGLRSGMGYIGCSTINQMPNDAEFVRITGAGYNESHVHGVTPTKEPPNYQIK